MTNEISFGHLYLPTRSGGVFRDEFFSDGEQIFCSFYANSGATSPIIDSYKSVDISQVGQLADLISMVGAIPQLSKIASKVWKKLAWFHKNPSDIRRNLWPKVLSTSGGDLQDFLFNSVIALRTERNYRVNEQIINEAQHELLVLRVAFSEDLANLYNHINRIAQGCIFELNLASPRSLRFACERELDEIKELEKVAGLFTTLESKYDIQARSKYLQDANANFARATCDSICALRAVQNYIEFVASYDDAKRFTLRLFSGEPSLRGTITDRSLAYVSAKPWVPGMMGDLHVHMLNKKNTRIWKQAKEELLSEIKSMVPEEYDYYTAREEMLPELISILYESPRRVGKNKTDIEELENMVRAIDHFKPTSRSDILDVFDRIQKHRQKLRDKFGEIYPRLDETIISNERKSVAFERKSTPQGVDSMSSILFLAADPTDISRLRLGEEFREIQEKIKLAEQRDNFKLELPQLSVRPADISQAMLDTQPQIVHFSGHGMDTGALCFENPLGETHPVHPDALAALFEQFSSQVNCVILNACYSETQANAIAKHVDYVIGMNQAIGDKAAIAFAIGFYQGLGAGRSFEEAYKLGVVQIQLQGISEHLTPVLKKK